VTVIEQAASGDEAARVAESVLRALPRWFGLEDALRGYVEDARRLPTLLATEGPLAVGFLTLKRHTPRAAEIVVMGVLPDEHRRGIGRGLVEAASDLLSAEGVRLLQVKTLGPPHPSESYARTRAFYESLGFVPLEETTAFWGEANPCLVMVRQLSRDGLGADRGAKIALVSEDVSRSEGFFGEDVASVYDERSAAMFDPAVVTPVVDVLAELAGEGAALEFAIGTGRIALPLAERGVRVHGIDNSEAMVARLRAKPGGEDIDVTIGDFATTRVDGPFALVYLVFNTIFNLVTQDAQVACFENAAAQLVSGGRFVIETGVPGLQRLPLGQTIIPFRADPDGMGFDVYDVVTQRFSSQHYAFEDGRVRVSPVEFRYAWPAELDLMARIAGLTLQNRWAGWKREPFTSVSRSHVSVYAKP
jgi:GNAT superfamily N-acetyltransferase